MPFNSVVSFAVQKLFEFDIVLLVYFSFVAIAFGITLEMLRDLCHKYLLYVFFKELYSFRSHT